MDKKRIILIMFAFFNLLFILFLAITSRKKPITNIDLNNISIYSIAYICFGVVLICLGSIRLKKALLISKTPTSHICDLTKGSVVEINGKVVPLNQELLKSPITYTPCVYYKLDIKEPSDRGKSNTIFSDAKYQNFFLEDDTGRVLVDPYGAEVDVTPNVFLQETGVIPDFKKINELENYFKNYNGTPSNKIDIASFGLREAGQNKGPLSNFLVRRYYYEYVIKPSQQLYVIGTAEDNPYAKKGSAQKSNEDIIIQKGNNTYVISTRSEKELLNELYFNAIMFIAGGVVILTTGIFWL